MFKNWAPGDWIGLFAVLVPVFTASVGAFWMTARRLGVFETEYKQMRADIADLKEGQDKFAGLDTSIKLVTQGMRTMQEGFVEFRREIREDRQETRQAIAGMRSETQAAMADIREDVRMGLSGKINRE